MPKYQYACTECEHTFEQFQNFSDDTLTTCPQCQGRLRKLFNAVGVVFKGSGFYRTDNRTNSGATASTTGSSSDSSSAGTSGSSGSSTGSAGSESGGSTPKPETKSAASSTD